jgi:Tfp pilus assembly protein PilV
MHNVKKTLRFGSGLVRQKIVPTSRAAGIKAFSLFEVMVAGTVLALAITTALTTVQRAFLSLDTARNLTTAGQILQCEMEKLRMRPWAIVGAYPLTSSPETMTMDPAFASNAAVNGRFQLYREVADVPVPTGSTLAMRKITFTVTWTNYDGRSLSRFYTTHYGKEGLNDYYYNSL